jgi:SAM-dependent methyltransferase
MWRCVAVAGLIGLNITLLFREVRRSWRFGAEGAFRNDEAPARSRRLQVKTAVRHAPAEVYPLMTPSAITSLWNKVRPSEAYLNKYSDDVQNEQLRVKLIGQASNDRTRAELKRIFYSADYPRSTIIWDFVEWTEKHNLTRPKSLLTTFLDVELDFIHPQLSTQYKYGRNGDEESGDLHALFQKNLIGEPFDFVFFSQTLEHLYDPLLCLRNLFNKMSPGGHLFTSTPAVNKQHMTPVHFFHYTPMGLAVLLRRAGFEIVQAGQWGNYDYELELFKHADVLHWPNRNALTKPHIVNSLFHPCQVWALVRKPL